MGDANIATQPELPAGELQEEEGVVHSQGRREGDEAGSAEGVAELRGGGDGARPHGGQELLELSGVGGQLCKAPSRDQLRGLEGRARSPTKKVPERIWPHRVGLG